MRVQARFSVLVLAGLVALQGALGGSYAAGLMAIALATCVAATALPRLLVARLVGLRHRRTVFHGLGASHDFGRLSPLQALLVHGAGIAGVGLATLVASQGGGYIAMSIAGIGMFWTCVQLAPVQPTCGGDLAWTLLCWALGPVRGEDISARLTLFGALAGIWAALQVGMVFLIPLSTVALHHGWQVYRNRTTEPPELLVLPGVPA